MLILFHDLMWNFPVNTSLAIEDVEFTTDRQRYDEAAAVVFHLPEWPGNRIESETPDAIEFTLKKRPGQLWVAWSMECDQHFPNMLDARFMRNFDLRLTYHLDADVPATYVHSDRGLGVDMLEAFRRAPSVPKLEQPLVASFVSSGFNQSGRQAYLRELSKHLAIDSCGKFMRNKTIVPDNGTSSKFETIAKYKFTIAFENACSRDYVTEKFYDPLWVGSVPVYLGAPNVEDFAPGDHCFIDASDFPDPKALADYLLALARDDDAYNAFFEWKKKPFRENFEKLVAQERVHSLTRLCKVVRHRVLQAERAP